MYRKKIKYDLVYYHKFPSTKRKLIQNDYILSILLLRIRVVWWSENNMYIVVLVSFFPNLVLLLSLFHSSDRNNDTDDQKNNQDETCNTKYNTDDNSICVVVAGWTTVNSVNDASTSNSLIIPSSNCDCTYEEWLVAFV